jgi:YggT family protein
MLLLDAIDAVQTFVNVFAGVYSLTIIAYIITSWVRLPYSLNPVQRFLYDVCEPYLRLWRRLLPLSIGPLDLSPIVGLLALGVASRLLIALLEQFH